MSDEMHFIEVEPEEPCSYCGRRKLAETDRYYRVFVGDKAMDIVICELCKGGFSTRIVEGAEKSYVTHLTFYVRSSLLGLKEKLPKKIVDDLDSAVESYESGEFSQSFRSLGLVAEWLTNKLFLKRIEEPEPREKEKLSWENKLGRLLDVSRKNKNSPEEAIVYQCFSLKWFRNAADHPSTYEITGDDVRIGLVSIVYLLQQLCVYNLIQRNM